MKIISFCLWGDNPKYCIGAIKNAQLARDLFPDWVCRFYVGSSVPKETLIALMQIDNEQQEWPTKVCNHNGLVMHCSWNKRTEIVLMDEPGDWRMMLYRFSPIGENDVEVMISRDCDSRLSLREKLAVNEWLASDKSFHTMHCHFHHSVPILGGMFGIKKGLFSELSRHAIEWAQARESRWQIDQDFLKEIVWPIVKHDTLNHADFHTNIWPGVPFPTPMTPGHFIGATYDENDIIDAGQLRSLYG